MYILISWKNKYIVHEISSTNAIIMIGNVDIYLYIQLSAQNRDSEVNTNFTPRVKRPSKPSSEERTLSGKKYREEWKSGVIKSPSWNMFVMQRAVEPIRTRVVFHSTWMVSETSRIAKRRPFASDVDQNAPIG